MLELAEELYDQWQCSVSLRHWKREELEAAVRQGAELSELVLEVYTKPKPKRKKKP